MPDGLVNERRRQGEESHADATRIVRWVQSLADPRLVHRPGGRASQKRIGGPLEQPVPDHPPVLGLVTVAGLLVWLYPESYSRAGEAAILALAEATEQSPLVGDSRMHNAVREHLHWVWWSGDDQKAEEHLLVPCDQRVCPGAMEPHRRGWSLRGA